MSKIKVMKYELFFSVILIIFTLSFSTNILRVTDDNFRFFDRVDETMIIGRLIASQHESPLAHSGLPGGYSYQSFLEKDGSITKKKTESTGDLEMEQRAHLASIYDDYVKQKQIYNGKYVAYKSQPGGQGILYSLLQEILPVDNGVKLQIFRLITIILSAAFLAGFMTWIYKNFGLNTAIVTFILSAHIPIFILFGYSLWWALWSYYIPFCTLLFVLDRRDRKGVELFDNKLLVYTSITVFLKFFFTGFEFISSTLVMSVCPIIYYLFLKGNDIKSSVCYFIKSTIAALVGIVVGTSLLITQIFFLTKNWNEGVEYILNAFFRRSIDGMDDISTLSVLKTYFAREVFRLNWNLEITIKYSTLFIIISVLLVGLYLLRGRLTTLKDRKYYALIMTTFISVLAPLSWFIIFTQHAFVHSLDIIVWYFPFCLFGFAIIGVSVNTFINELRVLIDKYRN